MKQLKLDDISRIVLWFKVLKKKVTHTFMVWKYPFINDDDICSSMYQKQQKLSFTDEIAKKFKSVRSMICHNWQ